MGWLLLISLLAPIDWGTAKKAVAQDDASADLTPAEKASMPQWMANDYAAERAGAGANAGAVVAKYRQVLANLARMPLDRRGAFLTNAGSAGNEAQRNQIIAQYTGVRIASPPPPPENGLPRNQLTDFEKMGQLPEWLSQDYRADMARAGDNTTAVTQKYRQIILDYNALSESRKAQFNALGNNAGNRADRDNVLDRFTTVGSNVPIKTIHFTNDDGSLKLDYPQWHPNPDISVGGNLKFGALAPMGKTGDQNSTLLTSPYVRGAISGAYDGSAHALVLVTGSLVDLRSEKLFMGQNGAAASNAGDLRTQQNFSQSFALGSAYADVGYTGRFGDLRTAFYAAGSALIYSPTIHAPDNQNPVTPLVGVDGGIILMVKKAADEWTAYTDLRLQGVSANQHLFGDYTVSPSVTQGLEYAHITDSTHRWAVGVEGTAGASDAGVRPYLSLTDGDLSGMVAGNFRHGFNDIFPDVAGGAARVSWQALPIMKVGLNGSINREVFDLAPAPEVAYTGGLIVDFNIDKTVKVQTGVRAPERYYTPPLATDSARMNANVPNAQFNKDFKTLLQTSPSFDKLINNIGASNLSEIFAAIAKIHSDLNNVNYDAKNTQWAGTDEVMYENLRTAVLSGKNVPDLQCVGLLSPPTR